VPLLQVTKKLARYAAGTSTWATNVGNEIGQVLMCVLTSGGEALRPMAKGLVERYEKAGVTPPLVLYTGRDCCGGSQVGAKLFPEWSQLQVRFRNVFLHGLTLFFTAFFSRFTGTTGLILLPSHI